MTKDASTAYICIYCPFNSDNLEALETHLINAHGHGCQDVPPPPLSNIIIKANKREAPADDEQSRSSSNGNERSTEHTSGIKRVKRTLSPSTISTPLFINNNDGNIEPEEEDEDDEFDDDDEDDERDSSATTITTKTILTCPTCTTSYRRIGHLLRHMKRKHNINLSNYNAPNTFDMLTAQAMQQIQTSEMDINRTSESVKREETIGSTEVIPKQEGEVVPPSTSESTSTTTNAGTITECPYCDFKTTDIEQFKFHIAAHIRDKNYRCLLCNRLYKYRGDCSFHIRRKHHRYSTNSNDYIQRFLFDTTDGDESMSVQPGGHGSTLNGTQIGSSSCISREQDEPVRYFGCPYCDYTSNYGGDVRKHQTRKHPNVESKVIKIVRQDSEQQSHVPVSAMTSNGYLPETVYPPPAEEEEQEDDDDDEDDSGTVLRNGINHVEQTHMERIRPNKTKKIKNKTDSILVQTPQHPVTLPILSNFAPVRVFQCSSCHQQGTYKWVVERHIRAKHPEQPDVRVIELPAELAVKMQKITPPLKRFRCSLCPLQSKHTWVIIRHIKHFHTLQTASVLDIQPDGSSGHDESFALQNGEFSGKSYNHDSESSSLSSSCVDTGLEGQNDKVTPPLLTHNLLHLKALRQQLHEEEDDEEDGRNEFVRPPPPPPPPPSSAGLINTNGAMVFIYQCSLCDFSSNVPWNIQKHLHDIHPGQSGAHMITHCQSIKSDTNNNHHNKSNNNNNNVKKSKNKNGHGTITTVAKMIAAPLSPTSALAKAKFSPAVEEALLSLQSSKLNAGLYAVQPKFGIKRLKCRHCFYRSNWKTDMIRHVRIRHNLTEPDHNKDMIMMTEQEARATIELYENTFGKELRRRTFRTWNDWAKAEQEFAPKDGSLQYTNKDGGTMIPNENHHKIPSTNKTSNNSKKIDDETKRRIKAITPSSITSSQTNVTLHESHIKIDPYQQQQPKANAGHVFTQSSPSWMADDLKPLPNPSNIVSRLLLTSSPSPNGDDDDAPLDLSLKPSVKSKKIIPVTKEEALDDDEEDDDDDEMIDGTSSASYSCSECPFKHSNWSLVQRHVSLHLMGRGVICPICSYTIRSRTLLNRHLTTKHPTSQSISLFYQPIIAISTAHVIEQHTCSLCSYQCNHAENLTLHRRREHDEEEFDIDESSNDNDELTSPIAQIKNLFECPLCSPSSTMNNHLNNLEQLTIHIFTMHNNNLHNNQACPFCSFIVHTTTTSVESLVQHIKLHFNGTLNEPDPLIGIEQVKELMLLE